MNSIHMTMAGDITNLVTQKLAVSNQEALDRSIFVTGLSGAGKTTLTSRLLDKFGLPLEETDKDPGIRGAMMRTSDMDDMRALVRDSTAYRAMLKPHVKSFLDNIKKPSLVEGTFLMEFPELLPDDARKIMVDTKPGLATKRRISREIEKRYAKGKPVNKEIRAKIKEFSKVLGQYYKPFFDDFRKRPDVELRKS